MGSFGFSFFFLRGQDIGYQDRWGAVGMSSQGVMERWASAWFYVGFAIPLMEFSLRGWNPKKESQRILWSRCGNGRGGIG